MPIDLEARRYPRIPLETEASIIRNDGRVRYAARTVDISAEGLSIQCGAALEPDSVYTVLFAIPAGDGDERVFALVDVAYSTALEPGPGFQVGLRFRYVGMDQAARIVAYLGNGSGAGPTRAALHRATGSRRCDTRPN